MVTYLGTGLPVVGVGFLATAIGLLSAVRDFAAAAGAACLLLLILLDAHRPAPASQQVTRDHTL